ncbi:MAG: hypothetical protein Q8Q58_00765, partial [Candidatus Rokubacteria bacterium]|nr:hypothetical protein [Candidatus Rokubacteria bacterium]
QFTLTANGSGFVSASTVRWNGAARTTTFVSATQLQATIPAADIVAVGTAEVTVFTPTPGGGTSGSATFTITPPTFALTVTVKGSAAGSVTSSPGGISCMPTCSASLTTNDSVDRDYMPIR